MRTYKIIYTITSAHTKTYIVYTKVTTFFLAFVPRTAGSDETTTG